MIRTIDAYLDRLFDLVAGTGASGRRLLNETEGHLNAARTAEMAAGHQGDEAEARAIARFGTPEQVADAHLAAGRLPLPVALARLFAAAFFFFGCTGVMFGLSGALIAGFTALFGPEFVAPDSVHALLTPERCAELSLLRPDAVSCAAASNAQHVADTGFGLMRLGVIGTVMLAGFGLARRIGAVRRFTILPNATMVASVGAVGFGLVAFSGLGVAVLLALDGARPGIGANLAFGLSGLIAFALFLPAAWNQLVRDRHA